MKCNFETLDKEFDWNHGSGHCIEYHVTYNSPSWSKGQWFNIEGLTPDGSLVDLLVIGYSYQYPWLVEGTYTK